MQMRPDIQIQSVLKAMVDVVLPALEPDNKLAQEQARLIIGMLSLMRQQLPLQFRFDCDELARLLEFSQELQTQTADLALAQPVAAELDRRARAAAVVLERAKAGPDDVLTSVRDLRAASSELVTAVFESDDASARRRVRDCVLAMSAEQLLRDRSWLLMQAWEPDPNSVPAIETLLR